MGELKCVLLSDGSSDKVLLSVIKWVLDNHFPKQSFDCEYADFSFLRNPPNNGDVSNRIQKAKLLYNFDVVFYHRDAEDRDAGVLAQRTQEIQHQTPPEYQNCLVCVVPIKMMEAWLLIDEEAIKCAAGNRNYKDKLNLPSVQRLESIPNPKEVLHELLKTVKGPKGKLNVHEAVHLVADYIEDFSPLKNLAAFQAFEKATIECVEAILANKK
ncbi:protein of unknown function [Flexibacter flexilis DSM 6793]|uniref:DUF4276 family protein n=1 Tax=Flexibacter flexilis DSM 6793 TaxID=927664 RepID=A0A1I1NRA1_9BACT|nr:hypothetical protein [Flexibacter flexilis]SFD00057.1 protein of unknown function [Flexibacter flexilis DSM 6793]